jgi:DNA (cytosine-5)-methyltransferase 1
MKRRILDLFCGTGGFSYGFEHGGTDFETVLGIDLLDTSSRTFSQNHPSALSLTGDIRRIRRSYVAERLGVRSGDIDIIIGGPPCQGFSSIRPFRSSKEDDQRNSLFEEFASFVNFFRPKVFVLENVVGLATHKGGETIEKMQSCFASLGYSVEWRILNAAHFGVPQKRERLIMIGAQQGRTIAFPNPTHHSDSPTIGYRGHSKLHRPEPDLFTQSPNLAPALSVIDAIGDLPPVSAGGSVIHYDEDPHNAFQAARRNGASKLSLHASTAHTPKMMDIIRCSGKNISSIPSHLITSGFSSSYSRLSPDEPSVTITVNFVHPASNRCIHPIQDRALTPREGARLQSFDDTYKFAGNRTEVVKQIGNAVPPLLGRAIGSAVEAMLA